MINGEQGGDLDVYTPLRNVVLLSTSLAYAEELGADIVVCGSKGFSKIVGEPHSYYDSTIPFYKMMEGVWRYVTENKRDVQIVPILAEGRKDTLTKKEDYETLLNYGFKHDDTWSCFKGEERECEECFNCLEKERIFFEISGERIFKNKLKK